MKTHCDICNINFKNEDALVMHNGAKHQSQIPKSNSNKKILLILGVAVGIIVLGLIIFSGIKGTSGNAAPENIQKITLSMKGNYYPNKITVKEGIPVEITLDSGVGGCYRSFNIPDLGVSGYSSNPSQTISFTPTKKGTFEFRCSMGMGRGTIVIE